MTLSQRIQKELDRDSDKNIIDIAVDHFNAKQASMKRRKAKALKIAGIQYK